jgi:hypothetical protein
LLNVEGDEASHREMRKSVPHQEGKWSVFQRADQGVGVLC